MTQTEAARLADELDRIAKNWVPRGGGAMMILCTVPDIELLAQAAALLRSLPDVEAMREAMRGLDGAFQHYAKVRAENYSVFIKENGRNGRSPWAELMAAIADALAACQPFLQPEPQNDE